MKLVIRAFNTRGARELGSRDLTANVNTIIHNVLKEYDPEPWEAAIIQEMLEQLKEHNEEMEKSCE
jgi:trimethylamine:corrinoid methyltransferase-like protein